MMPQLIMVQSIENAKLECVPNFHTFHFIFVHAGNEDIVNGNVKLILGMVWQLILRYQLSGGAAQDNDKPRRAILPKKLILQWVNGMLPEGQTCKNFSRDWNDGIILRYRSLSFFILSKTPLFPMYG